MKKNLILVLLFPLLLLSCSDNSIPDVNTILKNYYEKSGAEKLSKVETMRKKSVINANGMEMLFTETMKRPDKVRVETIINGVNNIRIFNGIEGWSFEKSRGETAPVKMSEEQVKQMKNYAIFDKELFIYKNLGYQIDSVYADNVMDKDVYVIKLLLNKNIYRKYFISKDNYEIIKIIYEDKERNFILETFPKNYKEINGIQFPMEVEIKSEGKTISSQKIESIELDIPVDDSIFNEL